MNHSTLISESFTDGDLKLSDPDLFNAIWQENQPGLYHLAFGFLKNQQEAEDVATESFIKLWQGDYRFSSAKAVQAWLRTTTRNACLNLLRQHKLREASLPELKTLMEADQDQRSREELVGRLLQIIYREIEALPPKSREVFKLRYVQGIKNEQIAMQLGINHQSVRDHLVRALKSLRLSLNKNKDLFLLLLLLTYYGDQ